MRERVMLVGGDLSLTERAAGGVELRLDVPATSTVRAEQA
jgi:signal transduction histidine kinase